MGRYVLYTNHIILLLVNVSDLDFAQRWNEKPEQENVFVFFFV